jgi:tRNA-uridine 2-sulfurtransferase
VKRVVVGLSGGVDSSVAAYLLKEQGYEVIGIFMRNWHDDSVIIDDECPWIDDSNDAMLVAEHLGIPFQVMDLSIDYKERIVDYMFREYEMGRTPNPDVLCNREIKFDLFLKAARNLNADFVATGHYCRKETISNPEGTESHRLLAGLDPNKDQSYFLCQLNQEQLGAALFPIGHLQKEEVRLLARSANLITAEKKDSQGLCFIGKVKLPTFLQQQLEVKQGKIIELPSEVFSSLPGLDEARTQLDFATATPVYSSEAGEVIGEHPGAHFYTVGQRKGLNVGGKAEPLFVIGTDVNTNTIYTGQGDSHPGLYRRGLKIDTPEIHWVREDLKMSLGEVRSYEARIRYRQPLQKCELHLTESGMYMLFDAPQRGIAPGQFAAWYSGEELIGSGIIAH